MKNKNKFLHQIICEAFLECISDHVTHPFLFLSLSKDPHYSKKCLLDHLHSSQEQELSGSLPTIQVQHRARHSININEYLLNQSMNTGAKDLSLQPLSLMDPKFQPRLAVSGTYQTLPISLCSCLKCLSTSTFLLPR